ncbi:AmmeMemoRadiSam system protein A [Candidatus Woesearchaeota archaeon]|nr:AmmeMemoRadiSam system protein A [Candidatus Woesearchaeota archaeon]
MRKEDGKRLLELARNSIKAHFSKKDVDLRPYSKFSGKQGVFVTLHKKGELRGCIGFPYPSYPLHQAVFEAARAAAFEDYRFRPLEQGELKEIGIEISVLTVPEEIISDPADLPKHIKIGEDGLIIKGPSGSGLLLPQVFTENDCTPERALEMTCQKAGMSSSSWKDRRNKIFKFQALVFSE